MKRITIISYSFSHGGAGMAAYKFFQLLKSENFKVKLLSQDDAGKRQLVKRILSFIISKIQYDINPIKHSLNLFSYKPVINSIEKDKDEIHHLHWINNDTISVFKLDKIPVGSIFTLHDEWLYCGAEHYYRINDKNNDFIKGYNFFKQGIIGLHLNYIIWKIKKKKLNYNNHIIYTVPSLWMLNRAKESNILKNKDVRYLPNPIDHFVFAPKDESEINDFRKNYSIKSNQIVICFGAVNGRRNKLKGGNLLIEALWIIRRSLPEDIKKRIVLLEFGGVSKSDKVAGFQRVSLGKISDNNKLALIYSTADISVVPSLVESFGQVAAESLACETPVVCFNCSGIAEIVIDNESGICCEPYEVKSLANGLLKIIMLSNFERRQMGRLGRNHIIKNFSYDKVRSKYLEIIQDAKIIKENFK